MKKLDMAQFKRHIRKCDKTGRRYDFLGLVENRGLTPEVEALFRLEGRNGKVGFDWVHGNTKLADLLLLMHTPDE